jgi:hypothetical protein
MSCAPSFELARHSQMPSISEVDAGLTDEVFQQDINVALVRLNEGSKYQSPASQGVDTFRKRISTRSVSVVAAKRRAVETGASQDPVLLIRSKKIQQLVEAEREYLGALISFQSVSIRLFLTMPEL